MRHHRFTPYANPAVHAGCVQCNYPRYHPVHHIVEPARSWKGAEGHEGARAHNVEDTNRHNIAVRERYGDESL